MTATRSSFSEPTKEINSVVMEATTMLAINKSLVKARYNPRSICLSSSSPTETTDECMVSVLVSDINS